MRRYMQVMVKLTHDGSMPVEKLVEVLRYVLATSINDTPAIRLLDVQDVTGKLKPRIVW